MPLIPYSTASQGMAALSCAAVGVQSCLQLLVHQTGSQALDDQSLQGNTLPCCQVLLFCVKHSVTASS